MRRAGALALALLLHLGSTSAQQSTPPAEPRLSPADTATLKLVDAHYNHLHSLRAEFRETYDGMGLHKVESGTLLLSKPGRMRWTYTEPAEKVFVLDGRYAWSYAKGDAQAQRSPAKQLDDLRSPLRLLLGHTSLARELTGIRITPEPGGVAITGLPRGEASRLRQLTVHAGPTGQINALRLEDIDDTATEFHFTAMQEDVPIARDAFTFTPPPGVPVVDGLPPI